MEQELPQTAAEHFDEGKSTERLNKLSGDTNYREMSDSELDTAIVEVQSADSVDIVDDEVIEVPEALEPDLVPSEVKKLPSLEDFGEPLADFEVHNLRYALYESDAGSDLAYKVEKNDGILTPELIEEAKSVGVSQRQIDGYISHQVNQANKIFADAGLSFDDGRNMMIRMKNTFSADEKKIFMDETKVDPAKSLQTLKAYFDSEDGING